MTRLYLLAVLLLLPTWAGAVGGYSYSVVMDPESRDSIEVSSYSDEAPTVGF